LSSLRIGVNEVASNNVIRGIHVDQREISGGGAGKSIGGNSKRGSNNSTASNGSLDQSEEGHSIAVSVLPEDGGLSVEDNSVYARSSLQTSLSVIEEGKSVSIGSKPEGNSRTRVHSYGGWGNKLGISSNNKRNVIDNEWVVSRQGNIVCVPNNSLYEGSLAIIYLIAMSDSSCVKTVQFVGKDQTCSC